MEQGKNRKKIMHQHTHSLVLCLYFIRTWFFVLLALHFALLTTQRSMLPAGFKPATPGSDRQLILALDHSATGIR